MFPDHAKMSAFINNLSLGAASAEDITKPTGYASCMVTPNVDCWVRRGGTAVVPSADVTDGTGCALIPAGQSRLIDFVDSPGATPLASVSIISAAGGLVGIEWFR